MYKVLRFCFVAYLAFLVVVALLEFVEPLNSQGSSGVLWIIAASGAALPWSLILIGYVLPRDLLPVHSDQEFAALMWGCIVLNVLLLTVLFWLSWTTTRGERRGGGPTTPAEATARPKSSMLVFLNTGLLDFLWWRYRQHRIQHKDTTGSSPHRIEDGAE